ncbi:hypothetical protein NDU88_007090 [Pleurodeles waltl]|uniref:Uncharacterized protein n=1 Tax=Pleurodeles waltl TaxID=8319 RepID=A0AAV7TZP0_PLEWA|nr:hypothetical protein NDU88_007090 [Pleurodeles waltl]
MVRRPDVCSSDGSETIAASRSQQELQRLRLSLSPSQQLSTPLIIARGVWCASHGGDGPRHRSLDVRASPPQRPGKVPGGTQGVCSGIVLPPLLPQLERLDPTVSGADRVAAPHSPTFRHRFGSRNPRVLSVAPDGGEASLLVSQRQWARQRPG